MEISKLKKGKTFTFQIEDMAFGGKGIARIVTESGKYPIFIPNTIPGQTVTAKIIKRKKNFSEAKLKRVVEKAPDEISSEYQTIPGAPYAAWPIEKQREHKLDSAREILRRIGKLEDPENSFDTFITSPRDFHYRNKMEYSFSAVTAHPETGDYIDGFGLGFKHRGQWLAVENLNGDSGLFDAQIENAFPRLRSFFENTGLPPWHPSRHEGFYRLLNFRKSFFEDKFLVNLTTSSKDLAQFDRQVFIDLLIELHGERIAGILHTVTDALGDRGFEADSPPQLIYGRDTVIEKISGLEFEISIDSFFQPNPAAAEKLYAKGVDYALSPGIDPDKHIYMDLFCGTGTIAQLMAYEIADDKSVIGVDIVQSAVDNAVKNAERNKLTQLNFHAADVKHFLKDYPDYSGRLAVLILDPPRAGIVPKALKKIIELNARRIVYISCNPASQARDLEILGEAGYYLKKWSVVDQFPHTSHIETVVVLEK